MKIVWQIIVTGFMFACLLIINGIIVSGIMQMFTMIETAPTYWIVIMTALNAVTILVLRFEGPNFLLFPDFQDKTPEKKSCPPG